MGFRSHCKGEVCSGRAMEGLGGLKNRRPGVRESDQVRAMMRAAVMQGDSPTLLPQPWVQMDGITLKGACGGGRSATSLETSPARASQGLFACKWNGPHQTALPEGAASFPS